MLEGILGVAAVLAILTGLAVIAGPVTFSRLGALKTVWIRLADSLRTQPEPGSADLKVGAMHPTTQKAMNAALRLAGGLSANGYGELARAFQENARRLAIDEPSGLLALHLACRALRRQVLASKPAAPRFKRLVDDLEAAITDRGEQLELLPFR